MLSSSWAALIRIMVSVKVLSSSLASSMDDPLCVYGAHRFFLSKINKSSWYQTTKMNRKSQNNENKLTKFIDVKFLSYIRTYFSSFMSSMLNVVYKWNSFIEIAMDRFFLMLMGLLFYNLNDKLFNTHFIMLTCFNRFLSKYKCFSISTLCSRKFESTMWT